jgi:hypothetical protein
MIEGSGSLLVTDRAFPSHGFRLMIAGSLNFKIVDTVGQPFEIFNLPLREPDLSDEQLARMGEWGNHMLEANRSK